MLVLHKVRVGVDWQPQDIQTPSDCFAFHMTIARVLAFWLQYSLLIDSIQILQGLEVPKLTG